MKTIIYVSPSTIYVSFGTFVVDRQDGQAQPP